MTAASQVAFLLDVDNTLRADRTIEPIGELIHYDYSALLSTIKAYCTH